MDFLDISLLTLIQDHPQLSIAQIKEMLLTPENRFNIYLTGNYCSKTLLNRLKELQTAHCVTLDQEIRDNGFRKYNVYQITSTGRDLCTLLSQKFAPQQPSSSSFGSEDLSVEISLLDFMELNLDETIAEALYDDIADLTPQSLNRCQKAQQNIIRSLCRMLNNHGVKIIESE